MSVDGFPTFDPELEAPDPVAPPSLVDPPVDYVPNVKTAFGCSSFRQV